MCDAKEIVAMLTIRGGGGGRFCDGISRRDFLKIGGLALGGLSLTDVLAAEARAGIRSTSGRTRRATTGTMGSPRR